MHIAIDARFWGLENTGLGRYVMELIKALALIDKINTYTLLTPKETFLSQIDLGDNFRTVTCVARHYSVREQWELPYTLRSINPDLFHVPHFNIPLLYRKPTVVTIHDLITKFSVGAAATTLPMPVYWLKWLAHKQVLRSAISNAKAILVPSKFTKEQILEQYAVSDEKIYVTHEAPASIYYEKIAHDQDDIRCKYNIPNQFIIYTGNVYPHKNVSFLIRSLKKYNQTHDVPLSLIVVCARNVFEKRLNELVMAEDMRNYVHFLGFVSDEDLRELYRKSLAFVMPSLLEGFGLPGLEAMAAGTLVISSERASLPEIYKKSAMYFNPEKSESLIVQIEKATLMPEKIRESLIKQNINWAHTYSWQKLAQRTLEVYLSQNSSE